MTISLTDLKLRNRCYTIYYRHVLITSMTIPNSTQNQTFGRKMMHLVLNQNQPNTSTDQKASRKFSYYIIQVNSDMGGGVDVKHAFLQTKWLHALLQKIILSDNTNNPSKVKHWWSICLHKDIHIPLHAQIIKPCIKVLVILKNQRITDWSKTNWARKTFNLWICILAVVFDICTH